MRIGLVGVGRIGAFHASTVKALPAVDEVVLTDLDTERAAAVAGELGVSSVATVDDLVSAGIDGAVITTGTASHAPLIRRDRKSVV